MSLFDLDLNYYDNRNPGTVKVTATPRDHAQEVLRDSDAPKYVDPKTGAPTTAWGSHRTAWGKLGQILQAPVGVIESAVMGVGETIGSAVAGRPIGESVSSGFTHGMRQAGAILTGAEEHSFQEVFGSEKSVVPKPLQPVVGLLSDVALDPTTYVGVGVLTKSGKVAEKASSLAKSGEVIREGSRLAREAKGIGVAAEDLKGFGLAGSRIEQARLGQRAAVTFRGKGITPASVDVAFEQLRSQVAGSVKSLVGRFGETAVGRPVVAGGEKVLRLTKQAFSTKSGNKVVDAIEVNSRDSLELRNNILLQRANAAQSLWRKLSKSDQSKVVEALEDSSKWGDLEGDALQSYLRLDGLRTTITDWRRRGVVNPTEIDDWLPRVQQKKADFFGLSEDSGTARIHGERESARPGRKVDVFAPHTNVSGTAKRGVAHANEFIEKKTIDEIAKIEQKVQNKVKMLNARREELKKLLTIPGFEDKEAYLRKLLAERKGVRRPSVAPAEVSAEARQAAMAKAIGEKGVNLDERITRALSRPVAKPGVQKAARTISQRDVLDRITELDSLIMEAENSIPGEVAKLPKSDTFYVKIAEKADETGKVKKVQDIYTRESATLDEVNNWIREQNKHFAPNKQMPEFETNPVVALTRRGLAVARAVTAKEYVSQISKFGKRAVESPPNWVEVGLKGLDGLRFDPEIARHIDATYKAYKPEELNKFLRVFQSVQNLWKAQALVAPSYHFRNFVSNKWNNFLAGLGDATVYKDAMTVQMGGEITPFVDKAGRTWTSELIRKKATELNVLSQGWYAKDIGTNVEKAMTQKLGRFNPLNRENVVFQANRNIGTAIENNDRLAHFLWKLKEGYGANDAAASVKKYLFDYDELTDFEKKAMKTIFPFYTWTRKNIPLQAEELFRSWKKFSGLQKSIVATETAAGSAPDERYLSQYIRDNIPVRVKTNKDGVTSYFLLGQWLPSSQAVDFLSQPLDNFLMMLTPLVKTPLETIFNKSTFFKDAEGGFQDIERTPQQTKNFLGITMRGKVANVLRNVRFLEEIDRLNPGEVFGSEKKDAAIKFGATEVPGLGIMSSAQAVRGSTTKEPTTGEKVTNLVVGKLQQYEPKVAEPFVKLSNKKAIDALRQTIKRERRRGNFEYAKRLQGKLKKMISEGA